MIWPRTTSSETDNERLYIWSKQSWGKLNTDRETRAVIWARAMFARVIILYWLSFHTVRITFEYIYHVYTTLDISIYVYPPPLFQAIPLFSL